jgi:hypothetical protein
VAPILAETLVAAVFAASTAVGAEQPPRTAAAPAIESSQGHVPLAAWQGSARTLCLACAGGASVQASFACPGVVLQAPPLSALMPRALRGVGILMLGARACSDDAGGRPPAAALPARIQLQEGLRPGGFAEVVAWARDEREHCIRAARSAGVRLLLSAAPLSPLTTQLCAELGIAAALVDTDALDAIRTAGRAALLRRWPRAAELPALLAPAAGFVCSGDFEWLRLGSSEWLRVAPAARADAPPLMSAVLRGPSQGLAREYEVATRRALRVLRTWLCAAAEPGPPALLLSLPGAGASELQLEALLARCADSEATPGLAGASDRGGDPSRRCGARRAVGAALLAPLRTLHLNAEGSLRPSGAGGARWLPMLQALRMVHRAPAGSHMGLVLGPLDGEGPAHAVAVADARTAGVTHAFEGRVQLIADVLRCMTQLLRLDAVVPVRSVRSLPRDPASPASSASSSDDED